jgi:hypothetical protein
VAKLVATGAIPRKIEDGVALEQRYLEITKAKPDAKSPEPPKA